MFYPRYPLWKKIMDCKLKRLNFPPQHQDRHPAFEFPMIPLPIREDPFYKASGKLQGKVCIVLGGDSGIGASVAILYAKEGADLVIVYYDEHIDARATQDRIREIGQECLLIAGDLREKKFCNYVIAKTIQTFGKIDVLVLNQAIQIPQDSIEDISEEQLRATFETNVYPHFFITQAALPFLKEDARIIVTASVTAYGKKDLIDYSATKGSLVTFTRSLAKQLAPRRILVKLCGTRSYIFSFDDVLLTGKGCRIWFGNAMERGCPAVYACTNVCFFSFKRFMFYYRTMYSCKWWH